MVCGFSGERGADMSLKTHFQPIEWADTMATGIATIDRQHRFLIDTLKQANEKLLQDGNDALLAETAKVLLSYALTHFETEEALMQRYGYEAACPEDAHAHVAQHRDFSRRVVALRDQLREGREVSRIEVLTFLNHWLRNHVLGIDQRLGAFLRHAMAETNCESGH
jgi:hemerythrin